MANMRVFGRSLRFPLVVVLLASTISTALLGGFTLANTAFQSTTVPVSVDDPIQFSQNPVGLSLFPGETKQFTVELQNLASVGYTFALSFKLNDTAYQAAYVTFSDTVYDVLPGKQTLQAWLAVSKDAPPTSLLLTVSRQAGPQPTATPTLPCPTASPSPVAVDSSLHPSVVLFGAGARWASPNGTSALYIDWKDNYALHHLTDGANWGPWEAEGTMDQWRASITQTLKQNGFSVNYSGEVPKDITGYDLVVVEAFYAIEPCHSEQFRQFIANGGGVVSLGCVPCFFSCTCKDRWPYRFGGTNLAELQDWFGYQNYVNVGGKAHSTTNNPLGTQLTTGTELFYTPGGSAASVFNQGNNTQVIATYDDSGTAFAFTHEYGNGRLYWQGHIYPY